ncbi:MAG: molybdenum cofactor biosynthesis protein MoaE [Thermoprotei archaeon]|nr:MAG: molybdenum cofactor biosynthesis protein MoaE [Thermoprotei archaeon]
MVRVKITEKLSEIGDIIQEVKKSSEDIGAILVFIGVVRGSSPLGKVLRLEYEVHEKLAYKKLEEIAKNVKERYSVIDIVIEHRKGSVNRGENIMYVVVASKHRKEGFEALMEIINRLKEEVPIWKKEVTEHGYRWVEG